MATLNAQLDQLMSDFAIRLSDKICSAAVQPRWMGPQMPLHTREKNDTGKVWIRSGGLLLAIMRENGRPRNGFGATVVEITNTGRTIHIIVTKPYAAIQHFGGTITFKSGRSIYIKPKPYLIPAAEEVLNSKQADDIFQESLDKVFHD